MTSSKQNFHCFSCDIVRVLVVATMALAFIGCQNLVSGFSHTNMIERQHNRRSSMVAEMVSTSMNNGGDNSEGDDQNYYQEIFQKAREFALESDAKVQGSSSLTDEEALLEKSRFWLSELLRLPKGIEADEADEIMNRLIARIEKHERRIALRQKGTESIVPWIATELSVGALVVVVLMFWTTLDIGQRHDDIPSFENYQQWIAILREKEYLFFGGWFQ